MGYLVAQGSCLVAQFENHSGPSGYPSVFVVDGSRSVQPAAAQGRRSDPPEGIEGGDRAVEEEAIVGAEERRKGSEVRKNCSQQKVGKLGRV